MVLKHEINRFNREYYIEKVNAPLINLAVKFCERYPDPHDYEVLHPNSKRLLEIWDEYLEYEGNNRIKKVVNALLRAVISKMEHSPNWRDRIFWFVEKLREGFWKERSLNHPENAWNEPRPYGRKL